MTVTQGSYYYEYNHGVYYLMEPDGQVEEFRSKSEMYQYVDDRSALFIEVTPQNWQRLYDSGAFDQ